MPRPTKKLLIANWKANKTWIETQHWLSAFSGQQHNSTREYILCPPTPFLVGLQQMLPDNLLLGIQDVSVFDAGAYTGEVTAYSLQNISVHFALLGHSERRLYQHETDSQIAQKAEQCVAYNITPIICIDTPQIISQITLLSHEVRSKAVFAYEPAHAISSFGGHEDPLETTLASIARIRDEAGADATVLYGGSVDRQNSLTYLANAAIDGALVGKASLDPIEFCKL